MATSEPAEMGDDLEVITLDLQGNPVKQANFAKMDIRTCGEPELDALKSSESVAGAVLSENRTN
jgi:hypothetical protein